jgi:cytochrome c oxidase subunit III
MQTNSINLKEGDKATYAINPKKFIVWLFIVSIVMIFAALTSAYMVRRAEGNWLEFELPSVLLIDTLIIVLSSVFLHWAYLSAKKDNLLLVKLGIGGALFLGLTFLVGQYAAWADLVNMGVYFVGNPAGSFLYVLTGMHAFHLITGLVYLAIVLRLTFNFKVHSKNLSQLEMCMTYWHFLGGLWIYLYFFLHINH